MLQEEDAIAGTKILRGGRLPNCFWNLRRFDILMKNSKVLIHHGTDGYSEATCVF